MVVLAERNRAHDCPRGAEATGILSGPEEAADVPGMRGRRRPILPDRRMRPRAGTSGEKSLRALYDGHASVLLAYSLRLTDGDRARAEDIVQETLLRAWRNLESLDEQVRPVRPWLFTVAQHLAIDAHRARRARPPEVGDAALEAVPSLDDLESTLDRILVTDALQALSQEHRAVIVETYYRGRSVAEAATALGIPPGTVKSRCYYALRALKLALAERGVTT
jgi:RNA polymerase sigma-70 factor, ECF subfamily